MQRCNVAVMHSPSRTSLAELSSDPKGGGHFYIELHDDNFTATKRGNAAAVRIIFAPNDDNVCNMCVCGGGGRGG